jgi:phosphatidylinositol 4-kinase
MLPYLDEPYMDNREALAASLRAVAEKVPHNFYPYCSCTQRVQVCDVFCAELGKAVIASELSPRVYEDTKVLIDGCVSDRPGVRKVACFYMSALVTRFPSLLCEKSLVVYLLETLTLLRRAVESHWTDLYSPVYTFTSQRIPELNITLSEDFAAREEILSDMHSNVRLWLGTTIARTPIECQGLLQSYIDTTGQEVSFSGSEMGKSVAIELARTSPNGSRQSELPNILAHPRLTWLDFLPNWGQWRPDMSTVFASTYGTRQFSLGSVHCIDPTRPTEQLKKLVAQFANKQTIKPAELREALYLAGGAVLKGAPKNIDYDLIHHVVNLPIRIFTLYSVTSGLEVWSWLVDKVPMLEEKVMMEINIAWAWTMRRRKGLFSDHLDPVNPLSTETEYTPTNSAGITANLEAAHRLFQPHAMLINFLSSRYQSYRYTKPHMVALARQLVFRTAGAYRLWNRHPLAREGHLKFLNFACGLLQASQVESVMESKLRTAIYDAAFSLFVRMPEWVALQWETRSHTVVSWSFGSSRLDYEALLFTLREFCKTVAEDVPFSEQYINTALPHFADANSLRLSVSPAATQVAMDLHLRRRTLLQLVLENDIGRLTVWGNVLADAPLSYSGKIDTKAMPDATWSHMVETAWAFSPSLAAQLPIRFKSVSSIWRHLDRLLASSITLEEALQEPILVDRLINTRASSRLKVSEAPSVVAFWHPSQAVLYANSVTPILAIQYFTQPQHASNPFVLQYAMRALEQFPIQHTFFYIPQIVQGLRTDASGKLPFDARIGH